jgi:hypothetical protein
MLPFLIFSPLVYSLSALSCFHTALGMRVYCAGMTTKLLKKMQKLNTTLLEDIK